MLKVFLATFNGVWLGGDALIIAETKLKARNKLKKVMEKSDLKDFDSIDIEEVDINTEQCILIDDGDH